MLPCGRFGANATWLRLAILTHNVLTALKRLALPAELLQARPKRLRFLFFNTAGRLVHHARRTILRLASDTARLAEYLAALLLLPPAKSLALATFRRKNEGVTSLVCVVSCSV